MTEIDDIIVHAALEDGRRVCIRAVTPQDEPQLRSGIEQLSAQSRYLRFFSPAPLPPERVISKLAAVDGHRHLAWGAILSDHPEKPAIGVVHAVRPDETSSSADFAVGILDAYHGLGLARMLTAVLLVHCKVEGISEMDVQVLTENHAAASLVRSLGGVRSATEGGVSDYTIDTAAALAAMRADPGPAGLRAVFAAFAAWL